MTLRSDTHANAPVESTHVALYVRAHVCWPLWQQPVLTCLPLRPCACLALLSVCEVVRGHARRNGRASTALHGRRRSAKRVSRHTAENRFLPMEPRVVPRALLLRMVRSR